MATPTPKPKPTVAATPKPSPSNGPVGSGTKNVSQTAKDAVAGLGGGGTSAIKTLLPGQQTINKDAEGNPIAYYPVDFAENTFAKYAEAGDKAGIEKVQRQLASLNVYPKGYTPKYGFYTQTDVDALKSIGMIGEQLKQPVLDKLFSAIKSDPSLLKIVQTGGVTATKTLTSQQESASILTEQFLNVFNVKPTAAEVKAYANAVNAKEKSSKNPISSQERQDILLNVMNQKAAAISKTALTGDTKAAQEGSFGATVRSLRNEYFDNGVKVTDQTLYKQAAQAMRGSEAYNNIVSDIQINAKAMLPALSQYIDQGKKVRNILNSHIQRYADIYGVDPNTVDLNQIAFVANGQNLMSTTDMVKQLWNTDPKIKQTQYYKDVVTNDARSLLGMIGLG